MGRVLSQLHWGVGVDGMDCELVLGGDEQDGLKFWILDFNQCTRWLTRAPMAIWTPERQTTGDFVNDNLCSGAKRLARRIAHCEQYYPKPHQTELYSRFKDGYEGNLHRLFEQKGGGDDDWEEEETQPWIDACDAFLAEYERLDKEAQERKARLAKPPTRAEMEAEASAAQSEADAQAEVEVVQKLEEISLTSTTASEAQQAD